MACSIPVRAQWAGAVSLASADMFRGESASGNDPVVSGSISIESNIGLFAGASAGLAVGEDRVRFSSLTQYAGYALRTGEVSVEAGLIHRSYDRVTDKSYRRGYFEGYAGMSWKRFKVRAYVSPDYLKTGGATIYGEVDAHVARFGTWSLDTHGGIYLIPKDDHQPGRNIYTDWRAQVGGPAGPVFVSLGVARTNYPVLGTSHRARAFATVGKAF